MLAQSPAQGNMEIADMQFDTRVWMLIGAVLLIIIIVYGGGILGNGSEPEVTPTEQTTQPQ